MTTRYRFDQEHSRFTVQAFAAGLLSFLGHSPTFAARAFAGTVEFEDELIAKMRLELTVEAGSLAAASDGPGPARREMEDRMRGEVLETSRFPEIAFRAAATSRAARTGPIPGGARRIAFAARRRPTADCGGRTGDVGRRPSRPR